MKIFLDWKSTVLNQRDSGKSLRQYFITVWQISLIHSKISRRSWRSWDVFTIDPSNINFSHNSFEYALRRMYRYLENERAEDLYPHFVRYHCTCIIQILFQAHRDQLSKNFVPFISHAIVALAQFELRFKHIENKSTESLFSLFCTLSLHLHNLGFASSTSRTDQQRICSLYPVRYWTSHLHNSYLAWSTSRTSQKKHCFLCFIHYRTLHSHKSSFASSTSKII